jgi:hypothetical protein
MDVVEILKSDIPPSMSPRSWGMFFGHEIVSDGGDYGYPGYGFERVIGCSCGKVFQAPRAYGPGEMIYDLWRRFRAHVAEEYLKDRKK